MPYKKMSVKTAIQIIESIKVLDDRMIEHIAERIRCVRSLRRGSFLLAAFTSSSSSRVWVAI